MELTVGLLDWASDSSADVQAILRSLAAHGVSLTDVNPGNISFGD